MLTGSADTSLLFRFRNTVYNGNSCHLWLGPLNRDGYGIFAPGRPTTMTAHRWHWIAVNGVFDAALVVDHICRNRACVRLEHLRLLTRAQKCLLGVGAPAVNAQKVLGKCGHNLTSVKIGERRCVECLREWRRKYMRLYRANKKLADKA